MLFLLFFLYRDGDLGIAYLRSIVPLNDRETDRLFSRLVDTVQATVMGHFLVAAIQGLAAWVAFASLGVSSAPFLGVATIFFAMVPSFGAFVVWVPSLSAIEGTETTTTPYIRVKRKPASISSFRSSRQGTGAIRLGGHIELPTGPLLAKQQRIASLSLGRRGRQS